MYMYIILNNIIIVTITIITTITQITIIIIIMVSLRRKVVMLSRVCPLGYMIKSLNMHVCVYIYVCCSDIL